MRLLPREEKFFELFLQQVRLIFEAATLLQQGFAGGNSTLEKAAVRITELEKQADKVLAEIIRSLGQTFITPLDAEDIHSLGTHLDDVIDGIEDLAHRMVDYDINPIPPVSLDVAGDILSCVRALDVAFHALRDHGSVLESCIEVSRIEEVVDDKVRYAIRDLFRNEKDPIYLFKVKEVLDLLEETTDYCEDVSVALQNVVVKNS